MTTPVTPVPAPAPGVDVSDLMNRIFNSSNWRGEVEKTVKKNVRLSEKLRLQQIILDKLGAKFNLETGEPKEGKLLTKDEATQWDAFAGLKMKPEDIKKMSEEHGKLKIKDDERQQEEQFEKAAEALGYENVPALTRWLLREKLVLEFKDQRVEVELSDGTTKKVLQPMPYVRPAGDDKAASSPLEDYIETEVPEFVDIFKTKPEGSEEEEGEDTGEDIITRAAREATERVRKPARGGVRVPAMKSASKENVGSKDKRTLEDLEKNARVDPMYRI